MPTILTIEFPKHFSFEYTIFSHGWSDLSPFRLNKENQTLSGVFVDRNGENPVSAVISEAGGNLRVRVFADKFDEEKILRDVRHCLRLDDDLSEFYELVKKEKSTRWIAEVNAGRLLRSPTVYEDLVKTLCTTNCSWSLTKKMVANLVEKLGEPGAGGVRAFPTPEAMASVSADFYRTEIRAGYRSPYFAELAETVAAGKLNPESWLDSNLPAKELKKEMKKVKGVGDYAAENLLKLVGSYEGLALDSWLRAQFYKKHNRETICEDAEIKRFYAKFGIWQGLVLWCDMTGKRFD
ncbi:MAG: HhH-GPD family protein [Acidobacteria bacterium]|jgi:3-methyladenine DNA glycosylase/8-oxoguanine DNA glycosylase|nr:HhH-GPD family protein [Acidobacteriota bacterium]